MLPPLVAMQSDSLATIPTVSYEKDIILEKIVKGDS